MITPHFKPNEAIWLWTKCQMCSRDFQYFVGIAGIIPILQKNYWCLSYKTPRRIFDLNRYTYHKALASSHMALGVNKRIMHGKAIARLKRDYSYLEHVNIRINIAIVPRNIQEYSHTNWIGSKPSTQTFLAILQS